MTEGGGGRRIPFHEHRGLVIESAADGEAVVTLDLRSHHTNMRGVPHGGIVSAILDAALGAAVVSAIPEEWWCATVSLSVHFIAGARGGTLRAEGRIVRRGTRVAFAEGRLSDVEGRILATAQGVWNLWSKRPPA